MKQIQMLWELQNHDLNLIKLKEELNEMYKRKDSEKLKIDLNQRKYDLSHKKTLIEVNNVKIERNNNKIRQLNFSVKEKEIKLYDGSVTDLKQLTHLSEEVEEMKKQIEDYETNLLELMEEVESLNKEVSELEVEYNDQEERLELVKNEENNKINGLKNMIEEEQNEIEVLVKKIEKNLLSKYNKLKQTKGKAIVEAVEGRCNGCHMMIPISLSNKLKNGNDIVQCDNCNRILYHDDSNNA